MPASASTSPGPLDARMFEFTPPAALARPPARHRLHAPRPCGSANLPDVIRSDTFTGVRTLKVVRVYTAYER